MFAKEIFHGGSKIFLVRTTGRRKKGVRDFFVVVNGIKRRVLCRRENMSHDNTKQKESNTAFAAVASHKNATDIYNSVCLV